MAPVATTAVRANAVLFLAIKLEVLSQREDDGGGVIGAIVVVEDGSSSSKAENFQSRRAGGARGGCEHHVCARLREKFIPHLFKPFRFAFKRKGR